MKNSEAFKTQIATLDDLPFHVGRVVKLGNREIAVFRLSSGEVKAVENCCPHKGGPLSEGIVAGDYVYCPLHDWKIALSDGDVQFPDTGCVKTFAVEVIEDKVMLLS